MPSPLGTHIRFASNSEASTAQHFIMTSAFAGAILAFFTHEALASGVARCDWSVAFRLPSSHP
jgi:hypothetical protein